MPSAQVEKLLSTDTIRSQARRMLDFSKGGKTHFSVHLDRLDACADLVVETIRANYPDLKIPFHSRWGHFQAGGVDRLKDLRGASAEDKLDLVVVSVLLDAGAGMAWKYHDAATGQTLSKSEGLAVASLRMFQAGKFSSDPGKPWRSDARGLRALKKRDLEEGFQVTGSNPLLGVDGRYELLQSLATALENAEYFGPSQRVGGLIDWYRKQARAGELVADGILRGVQLALGSIWPGRLSVDGFNLGDVWEYPPFGSSPEKDWVPFHKLSQWLSYSLIEPLNDAGLKITHPERLTGLPEYRNGGLFVDSGVLVLRDPKLASKSHHPGSELVVEWRALTVELLEHVAVIVREKLKLSAAEFPLGKVLEGGTWHAGRKIAAAKRTDGGPPLQIASDGTVF